MLGIPQKFGKVDLVAAAEKNPNFETETAAGLGFSEAQQPDKALVYFEKALTRNPTSGIALNNVCSAYNSLKNWNMAIPNCEKAIGKDPNFQLAKNNLKYAQDQEQIQLKLIETLKAKSKSKDSKERRMALVDLGFEYYKMANYTEAVEIWKNVDKVKDDISVRTLNNLGSAYIILKKFDLAQVSLEEAGEMDPNNQLVKNNMAWLKTEFTAKS